MSNCPCCSRPLLRCIRKQEIYWFCPHCRQEMPDLTAIIADPKQKQPEHLSHFWTERETVSLIDR